jgi:hypothetical protein
LNDKKDLQGDPDKAGERLGPPPVPVIAGIHQKVFEAASKEGALDMGKVHTCNTTHCRAGWAVHLAGADGYELERFYGWTLAAQLIFKTANPELSVSPPRFFETNEQALADMKRMAELEAEQS